MLDSKGSQQRHLHPASRAGRGLLPPVMRTFVPVDRQMIPY